MNKPISRKPISVKKQAAKQSRKGIVSFVENYYGRGSATAKISKNPESIISAARKAKEGEQDIFSEFEFRKALGKAGGVHTTRGKGRKQFIGLLEALPEIEVHERAHAAYARIKNQKGKKIFPLCSEPIAYSLMFEWMKKNNYSEYRKLLEENPNVVVAFEILKRKKSKKYDEREASKIGFFVSLAMEKTFTEIEMKKLRQELFEKEFNSPAQLIEWYGEKSKKRKGLPLDRIIQ